jgi:hypothetical protein
VAVAVAAVELLLLVILFGALIGKPDSSNGKAPATAAKAPAAKAAVTKAAAGKTAEAAPVAKPDLKRTQVSVLVLNGNGRQGAAAATAGKVSGRGYKIGGVANAPSHEYASSMVMFRRGFAAEAERLARDVGIKLVGPLDGIHASELGGAHAVLIVGR